MSRVLMGPLSRAVVVENPDRSLDSLLEEQGISVTRLGVTPVEAELVDVLQSTRAQILFKRSRVDRPVGRFVEYPRPVWPIHYPVKPAWLAAIEKEGSAAPHSKRTYDVAVFLPEPPPGAC